MRVTKKKNTFLDKFLDQLQKQTGSEKLLLYCLDSNPEVLRLTYFQGVTCIADWEK